MMKNKRISEDVTRTEEREIDSVKTADKPTEGTTESSPEENAQEETGKAGKTARKKRDKAAKKTTRKKGAWIRRGILVSAALALVMFCMYGFFHDRAEEYKSSPLEEYSNIAWLYRNCYMLYRDLYNAQTDVQKDYKELFVQPKEGYEWILEADAWDETIDEYEERYDSFDNEQEDYYTLRDGIWGIENTFNSLEENYSALNSNYDYVIRDNESGRYLTNMSEADLSSSVALQFFQLGFTFNEYGSVTVDEEMAGIDTTRIRKYANEAIRSNSMTDFLGADRIDTVLRYSSLSGPVNCTVMFRVSEKDWTASLAGNQSVAVFSYDPYGSAAGFYVDVAATTVYRYAHMGEFLFLLLIAALVCGLFLPVLGEEKPWREIRICSLPLEALLAIGIVVFAGLGDLVFQLAVYTASDGLERLLEYSAFSDLTWILSPLINVACLTAFFFCGWYLGVCARAVRDLSVREYIRQRCVFYRIFPFIKSKALAFYDEVCHFDVTRDANKMIWKIVLLNAAILFVISCFWVTGLPLTVVYSLLLYVLLRNYISKLQKKYGQLLHATNEIAEGNLNVKITEDLGVFEPFKPQILRIQNGFKNAVEEETKSQRMKAELITNVSHDLKTPLTAIITYINLLKEENITEEQRKEYLDTLERKSLRLKVLIEDLFEVSKANSQTVTLNIMDVDIMNLVKQVAFEMSDKLEASSLDVRMNLTDEKVILPLDSQKTYRVYENLLGNIAKYALPGTRVYINGFRIDDTVIITLKNISAQEITVDTAELTERFVRGDASRNTEGSGLGLAIAKGFMEMQGGELSLEVDGDLFKATTTWHV
ncbi:MAG: HAMP domain-containing histidine kinase [Lachnospiraceae bacterium]|nr:HAMP domain-containing histidine kinase [Lachnospiraceae bacterium]MCM1239123.1 HAMP domain-containing histidine kinase [Lachnospiraceae bacterium]